MKRRTNLFYNDNSVDSNFLTFSNFTEHLTGVFLATNFKMFPSRFLCFNIPALYNENYEIDPEKKIEFINTLVAYYENKLAYLRDKLIEDNDDSVSDVDNVIPYLGYLIDTIKEFDENSELVFQSVVTEQDYNGTFTDIICTIDSGVGFNKKYDINVDENKDDFNEIKDNLYKEYLYGWAFTEETNLFNIYYDKPDVNENIVINLNDITVDSIINADKLYIEVNGKTLENVVFKKDDNGYSYKDENEDITIEITNSNITVSNNIKSFKMIGSELKYIYDGPDSYKNVLPIFDDKYECIYNLNAKHNIKETEVTSNSIEFNVIIPLYSIVNMDFVTNNTILKDINENISKGLPDINTSITDSESFADNVPYGIWFSDRKITLYRDNQTNYAPSWSLLIGTQFKPFPTSKFLEQDRDVVSKMAGFATYAQILAKQADIYDKMIDYGISFNECKNEIEDKIEEIEETKNLVVSIYDRLNNITNIDELNSLKKDLENLKNELNDKKNNSSDTKHIWKVK